MKYRKLNGYLEELMDREGVDNPSYYPPLIVGNAEIPADDLFILNRRSWIAGGTVPGAVALRSQVGICNESTQLNPVLSIRRGGKISSSTGIRVFSVRYSMNPALFNAAGIVNFHRDGQYFEFQGLSNSGLATFGRGKNDATPGTGTLGPALGHVLTNTIFTLDWLHILMPNHCEMYEGEIDNSIITGVFWGEEWDIKTSR